MFRLTQTLLFIFLCSACFTTAGTAYGRQGEVTPLFPPSLNDAVDRSGRSVGSPAPWQMGSNNVSPTPARQQTAKQDKQFDVPRAAGNIDTAENEETQIERSVLIRRSPGISGTYSEPSRSKPNVIAPSDQSLDQSETMDQPEFGTVMTFPAQDGEHNTPFRKMGVYQPPQGSTQNQELPIQDSMTNKDGSSQPDIEVFKLASTKIPPRDTAHSPDGESQTPSSEPSEPTGVESRLSDAFSSQVVMTSIVGPDRMVRNVPEDFEIIVKNTLEFPATNIVVQILIPEDLTVTELDRHAWMDTENRTITWKVNQLFGSAEEVIRYSVVSAMPGRHKQSVTVGMEGSYQGQANIESTVIADEGGDNARRPGFENE